MAADWVRCWPLEIQHARKADMRLTTVSDDDVAFSVSEVARLGHSYVQLVLQGATVPPVAMTQIVIHADRFYAVEACEGYRSIMSMRLTGGHALANMLMVCVRKQQWQHAFLMPAVQIQPLNICSDLRDFLGRGPVTVHWRYTGVLWGPAHSSRPHADVKLPRPSQHLHVHSVRGESAGASDTTAGFCYRAPLSTRCHLPPLPQTRSQRDPEAHAAGGTGDCEPSRPLPGNRSRRRACQTQLRVE